MMYSEFVAGTGCKENEHNYKVFCNLEVMYMNTDMSKQEIYEYGKKLVDNRKSEQELQVESAIKSRIETLEAEISADKAYIEWKQVLMERAREEGDKAEEDYYRSVIKSCQRRILGNRREIAACKAILKD